MGRVEQAVLERNEERRNALVAADFDRLRQTMAEDLIFIHTTGKVETREEFLDRLTTGALRYNVISETNQRLQEVGDAAVLVSEVAQLVTVSGQKRTIHSVAMSLWSLGNSGWQMRTYQATTRNPDAAPPLPLTWP